MMEIKYSALMGVTLLCRLGETSVRESYLFSYSTDWVYISLLSKVEKS